MDVLGVKLLSSYKRESGGNSGIVHILSKGFWAYPTKKDAGKIQDMLERLRFPADLKERGIYRCGWGKDSLGIRLDGWVNELIET